jgi:hypothetical protein
MRATLLIVRRRVAARRAELGLSAAAVMVAAAIVGAVGVVSTISRQDYSRQRLEAAGPAATALHAEVGELAGEDPRPVRAAVERRLASFADVAGRPAVIDVLGPLAPRDEAGTRLVAFQRGPPAIRVIGGRAATRCSRTTCEALTLTGGARVGSVFRVGALRLRVVGVARVERWARPTSAGFGHRSFVLPAGTHLRGLDRDGTFRRTVAVRLDPERVRGVGLAGLAGRVDAMVARVQEAGLATRADGPVPLLRSLERTGRVAQRRMLLISAQAAILLLAFVAFVAAGRSAAARRGDDQLILLRAGRAQRLTVRVAEAAVPAVGGVASALAGTIVASVAVAHARDLDAGDMISAAVGLPTLGLMAALAVAAVVVVLAAERGRERATRTVAPWELGAAAALAALAWQTVSTGGLSADDVASERSPSPFLLLSPALAGLAGAAILLRALPVVLRAAERVGRGTNLGLRLALLGAARDRRRAAAAGVFVALTVGGAFFLLAYRTSLAEQTEDAAALRAGAPWRVVTSSPAPGGLTPVDRLARLNGSQPAPVLREAAVAEDRVGPGSQDLTVLGIRHDALPKLTGWRDDFSKSTPAALGERLGRATAHITGPRIEGDRLRVWVRGVLPLGLTISAFLAGDRFDSRLLANVDTRWRRVVFRVPHAWRGGRFVGISMAGPTGLSADAVQFGTLEQRFQGRWRALTAFRGWVPAAGFGVVLPQGFRDAPIRRGVSVSFYGPAFPFIRPGYRVPRVVPAIVSGRLAREAVDGRLVIRVRGERLRVAVVGTSRFFPGIVHGAERFVVADYDTLLTALDADRPGDATPREAWGVSGPSPTATRVREVAPGARLVTLEHERRAARRNALATGTGALLLAAAVIAALLAVAGQGLAARRLRRDELSLWREYEALGVRPSTAARSMGIRAVLPLALGLTAAVAGGVLASRLVGALVALGAAGEKPVPTIDSTIGWAQQAILLGSVALAAVVAARLGSRSAGGPR